jgi:hypothetical protein
MRVACYGDADFIRFAMCAWQIETAAGFSDNVRSLRDKNWRDE